MSIFDKLTETDRELIQEYINNYGYMDGDDAPENTKASLSYILRRWAEHKEELFYLFGEQFILERPISFNMSPEEIALQMDNDFNKTSSAYYQFRQAIRGMTVVGSEVPLRVDYSANRYLLHIVEDTCALAENLYEGERVSIPTPDGKSIIFERGCKPMRLLGKVAKAYNLEEAFEEFRLWHSQKLNQKALHGTMCLSIHPLDYMTMSDNRYDWSSCMSWQDEGCYRSGTVECMNSEYVVVAYLKGDDDMEIPGGYWNNKKWRSLFIVHDDLVTSIKGYPYHSDELNKIVLTWFKELLPGNYGEPSTYTYCGRGIALHPWNSDSNPNYDVEFYTSGHMYNDFGTHRHMGMFVEENMPPYKDRYDHSNCLRIDYSGEAVCIHCGSVNYMPSDETELCCSDCSYESSCESCGCHMSHGEGYDLDGRFLCSECYNDYRYIDPLTGDERYEPDMSKLFIVPNELIENDAFSKILNGHRFSTTFPYILVDGNELFWNRNLIHSYPDFFTCKEVRTAQKWWSTYNYVTPNDLTEDGLALFEEVIGDWSEDGTLQGIAEAAIKQADSLSS